MAGGLALAIAVASLGHISDAHLNPAVTLGLAVNRRFPWAYAPGYIIAQFTGAIAADLPQAFGPESDARSLKTLVRLSGHVPPPAFPSPLQSRHAAKAVTSRRPGRD